MKKYIPNGKNSADKIRDLVGQATATGEYTVANIEGLDVGAWPHDDPLVIHQDFLAMSEIIACQTC